MCSWVVAALFTGVVGLASVISPVQTSSASWEKRELGSVLFCERGFNMSMNALSTREGLVPLFSRGLMWLFCCLGFTMWHHRDSENGGFPVSRWMDVYDSFGFSRFREAGGFVVLVSRARV